jgi:hypothetical protein
MPRTMGRSGAEGTRVFPPMNCDYYRAAHGEVNGPSGGWLHAEIDFGCEELEEGGMSALRRGGR